MRDVRAKQNMSKVHIIEQEIRDIFNIPRRHRVSIRNFFIRLLINKSISFSKIQTLLYKRKKMASKKKAQNPPRTETYRHPTAESLLLSDVGTQANPGLLSADCSMMV